MIKTFIQQSGKAKDLRETCNLCGKMYSGEYYNRLYENDEKNVRAKSYENNKSIAVFRPEYIEVIESESGELIWKAVEQLPVHKAEFNFNSSLGLFQSCNRGEFGGILITPKNNIPGNFSNLFEFNNKVYAIDSLNHMGIGHTCIYEFKKELNAKMLFKTEFKESISLSSLKIEENRVLILVSGFIRGDRGTFDGISPCSYLFEISRDGFKKIAVFDFSFHYAYNMLLIDKELIVGMDKVIAFCNIETKEMRFLTPLTIEAENDIKKVNDR